MDVVRQAVLGARGLDAGNRNNVNINVRGARRHRKSNRREARRQRCLSILRRCCHYPPKIDQPRFAVTLALVAVVVFVSVFLLVSVANDHFVNEGLQTAEVVWGLPLVAFEHLERAAHYPQVVDSSFAVDGGPVHVVGAQPTYELCVELLLPRNAPFRFCQQISQALDPFHAAPAR